MSRNSAKWPRNFGRRGASVRRPQRIGPSNCLAKTQVCAKPKGEVYGLTPARCWKVKRRGKVRALALSEALNPSPSKRRP